MDTTSLSVGVDKEEEEISRLVVVWGGANVYKTISVKRGIVVGSWGISDGGQIVVIRTIEPIKKRTDRRSNEHGSGLDWKWNRS